ncbi:MAG: CotH kinase family protein [Fluviicola sp.]
MRKLLLVPFLLFCGVSIVNAQTLTNSNLPIFVITTPQGVSIGDDPRITAHLGVIFNGTNANHNINDPYNNYDGNIAIEIRGSTSQQYPKKGYGFETQDNLGNNVQIGLCGLPPENDWILYGPYPDKTLIRNVLTYHLFKEMGHYSPRTHYCELIIDGDYRGVYVLTERIKIDDFRLTLQDVSSPNVFNDTLTGGYVLKVDKLTGEVGYTWESLYDDEVLFQFHDPEFDELNTMQTSYMENQIGLMEQAIQGPGMDLPSGQGGWRDFIDYQSFQDFFILQELGRTVDGYRSSSFLYKDKDYSWNALIKAGPMWDFNLSFGNADYCLAETTTGWQYHFDQVCDFSTSIPFWWERLLDSPAYRNALRCRWDELRQGILSTSYINNFIDSVALDLQDARIRNFQRWPIIGQYVNWNGFVGQTYQEDVDYMKTWIQQRSEWIDLNLSGQCNLSTDDMEHSPEYHQAWPNPFNEQLTIGFSLFDARSVSIRVVDLMGREVAFSELGLKFDGTHAHTFNSFDWQSGSYFYSIFADGEELYTGKLVKQ